MVSGIQVCVFGDPEYTVLMFYVIVDSVDCVCVCVREKHSNFTLPPSQRTGSFL